jgi:hypothetical protein
MAYCNVAALTIVQHSVCRGLAHVEDRLPPQMLRADLVSADRHPRPPLLATWPSALRRLRCEPTLSEGFTQGSDRDVWPTEHGSKFYLKVQKDSLHVLKLQKMSNRLLDGLYPECRKYQGGVRISF